MLISTHFIAFLHRFDLRRVFINFKNEKCAYKWKRIECPDSRPTKVFAEWRNKKLWKCIRIAIYKSARAHTLAHLRTRIYIFLIRCSSSFISRQNETNKFKFMQNVAKNHIDTGQRQRRIAHRRMICEFLDYYSSRFDLNRCFSSSSIRRPSIEQQQHRKQHKLCARDFDAPKYFIIFLKSTFRLFASQLMLFFLFSFTLILRLLNAKVSRLPVRTKRILVIILYDSEEMWLPISNRIVKPNMVVPLNRNEYSFERWNHNSSRISNTVSLAYRFDENQYFIFVFIPFSFSLWDDSVLLMRRCQNENKSKRQDSSPLPYSYRSFPREREKKRKVFHFDLLCACVFCISALLWQLFSNLHFCCL